MKKILIIHTAFIENIVLSTPLIRKIKMKYKGSKIYYVTTPVGAAILKNNPALEEIIVYDKNGEDKGITGMFKIAKYIKEINVDFAIIPHRDLKSTIIAYLAGIKKRMGFENSEGRFLLTKKIEYKEDIHEVERLLQFVDLDFYREKKIEIYPGEEEFKNIDKIWTKYKLNNKKIIVIAPGSKWFTKMWPTEYFNQLLIMLSKIDKDIKIIIIGGKNEEKLDLTETKKAINLIGQTSLLDVAEILKRSDILVSNDSSPIHIASSFNTFIIAIFGTTTKELGFYPWSENSIVLENKDLNCRPCGKHGGKKCPKKHFECMLEIKPETVYEEIKKRIM